jgi:hypothetical protein
MYYPWDIWAPMPYIEYKYSIYGLSFDPVYNLVENPSHPTLKSEVIDMRDIARAIQNYQKWQST